MSQNVGQIDLGLDINQRSFNRQLNGIASGAQRSVVSTFSGLGKAIGVTLGVAAIASFGKSCLKLGSDLSEVQNVVDITFGNMADNINKFASTAIEQFGLSETSAKKYAGVFGGMSTSMGLSQQAALSLSKSVTGLTGDVASFFNISNEMAYTKLKSIWTGETETLKDLGVVMTQTNLQQFALSRGITKSIDKMTEAEKVMLRYEYVTKALSNASGDFARNSNSWANQTRILSEQFNALKATIGQGLIAAFTPIVKGLNVVIAKLRVAAGYFKAFMELVFGKQESSGGAGMAQVADSTSAIADSASGASDAVEGVGDAAKKAGKKAKGALASFDELNQLSISDGSGSDGGAAGAGLEDMGGAIDVDLGNTVEETDRLSTMFDGLIKQLTTMKDLFGKGFQLGISTADFDGLKNAIQSVKDGFMAVFSDGTILSAFTNMLNSMSLSLGMIVGSIASIGVTIATNLIGGFGMYLNQNAGYIKERLISIFDVTGEIFELAGGFSVAFAEVFSVFGGETSQQITANIIGMFSNGFLGAVEVSLKVGRDILNALIAPFIENKDLIKSALEATLEPIESVTGTIKDFVTNTFITINQAYDTYLKPAFDNITTALTNLMTNLLNNYNTYILPVIDGIASKVEELFTTYIQPNVDLIITSIGRVIESASKILNEVIEPMAEDLNNLLGPAIAFVIEKVSDFAIKLTGELFKALGDVADKIADVCDWLADHKLATEAIIITLGSFATAIGIVKLALNAGAIAQAAITLATTGWNVAAGIGATVTGAFGAAMAILTSPITLVVLAITAVIAAVVLLIRHWDDVKVIAAKCWESIKQAWNKAGDWFNTTVVQPLAKFFSNLWEGIKLAGSNAWNGLKNTWSGVKQWFSSTVIDPVGRAFDTMWTGVKTACSNAFNGIKNAVKTPLNFVIDMINKVIRGLNSLSIDIPDWVPGVGGSNWGVNIPTIPKLAKGGVVSQPTLAMVGEAGKEAVVPLQNNTEWTGQVASLLANALLPLLQGIGGGGDTNRDIVFSLDGIELVRAFLPTLIKEANRQGVTIG